LEDRKECYDKAIAHFTKLAVDYPEVPDYRLGLATCYGHLGMMIRYHGDWDGYAKYTRKSLDLAAELGAKNPTVTGYKERLALEHGCMVDVLLLQGEFGEGRKLLKDSSTHLQALHKSHPDNPRYRCLIVQLNYFLAHLDDALGQSADGPKLRQEADIIFD